MNSYDSKSTLTIGSETFDYFSLERAEKAGAGPISKLPFSLKVMIENLLRLEDGVAVNKSEGMQSDTAVVPRGTGTMGSRSLQIGGSALYKASEEGLAKAKQLAAHLPEANVADTVLPDDVSVIYPTPGRAVTLVGCYPFYHVGSAPQRFIVRAVSAAASD